MGDTQRDRWELRPTRDGNPARPLSENSIHPPGRPESDGGIAFDIVAVAASAGGLNALSQVLSGLPSEFGAAIVVVQHLDPRHRSLMADILSRRTSLRVKEAEDGETIRPGMIYIAPPDHHGPPGSSAAPRRASRSVSVPRTAAHFASGEVERERRPIVEPALTSNGPASAQAIVRTW